MGILDMVKVQIITFYLQTSFLRPQHLIIFACVFPYLHAIGCHAPTFRMETANGQTMFFIVGGFA